MENIEVWSDPNRPYNTRVKVWLQKDDKAVYLAHANFNKPLTKADTEISINKTLYVINEFIEVHGNIVDIAVVEKNDFWDRLEGP